jgi:hypothetical protein
MNVLLLSDRRIHIGAKGVVEHSVFGMIWEEGQLVEELDCCRTTSMGMNLYTNTQIHGFSSNSI